MISTEQIKQVVGSTAYDVNSNRIGEVGQVYLDDKTGEPAWVTVSTGAFGTSETFAPVHNASLAEGGLFLGFDHDTVQNAPQVAADGHLSPQEEAQLYDYYGVAYATADGHSETAERVDDGAMIRSEERLEVTGTETAVTGRARLRKYVETEHVTVTVPVRKEKVVLETEESVGDDRVYEPVSDAEAAAYADAVGEASGGAEGPVEVILQEEVPVVHT